MIMAKLRIVGKENGNGIKELSVDGQEIPLGWLSSFKYDSQSSNKGVLTLEYHVNGIDLIEIDSLKRIEVVETVESSQATKKLRSEYLENAVDEIKKYLEANRDKETSEWHLENASVFIKDALKF